MVQARDAVSECRERDAPSWQYNHIPDDVLPALREAGVGDEQIDLMMRLNPRAIFERFGAY